MVEHECKAKLYSAAAKAQLSGAGNGQENNVLDVRFQMRAYRYIARMLKVLAHLTRLAGLQVLQRDGKCCVCHLERALGKRQAFISQQLARLRRLEAWMNRRVSGIDHSRPSAAAATPMRVCRPNSARRAAGRRACCAAWSVLSVGRFTGAIGTLTSVLPAKRDAAKQLKVRRSPGTRPRAIEP